MIHPNPPAHPLLTWCAVVGLELSVAQRLAMASEPDASLAPGLTPPRRQSGEMARRSKTQTLARGETRSEFIARMALEGYQATN